MKKKKLIPFRALPGAWGLVGKAKERAAAEYYLTGEDLEIRLVEIEFDGKDLDKKLLDIQVKYNHISAYDRDQKVAAIDFEGEDLIHKLLRIEYEHRNINDQQYDKKIAELCGEPYIGVKSSSFDLATGRFGIEYDWNDQFIKLLVENGYVGVTESDIVQAWMNGQNFDNGSETAGQPGTPVNARTRKKKTDGDDTRVQYT
jgi:hypothetical protein